MSTSDYLAPSLEHNIVGADQRWRKGFIIAFLTMHLGTDFSTIRSVIKAHSGRVGEKLRYAFSHMILIASFLASRSSRSRPPIVIGFVRVLLAMHGEESSSHMKSFNILLRMSSMSLGIPWACVRNWVWPPMIIWVVIFLPFRLGCVFFHRSSLVLIVSITGSQGVMSSILFPIHAPSILTTSLSFAIQVPSEKGVWS
jgi:hypothetical protein